MNIKIAILTASLLLGGCASPREWRELTVQVANYGLQVYEDKPRGNVCYVYRDNDSPAISCLPAIKKAK